MTSYEINVPSGGIALVADFPEASDERQGRLLSGRAGRILDDALVEAGLRRSQVNLLTVSRTRPPKGRFEILSRSILATEVSALHAELARLKPSVIVALGAEAAHALIPDWPDGRDRDGLTHRGAIKRATDIENRRGYVFDSAWAPVVASVSPDFVNRSWSPWRVLLSHDLQRAASIHRNGYLRPTREVVIVGSDRDARRSLESLRRFGVLSADIETWGDTSLACIGFAGESGEAHVFPAEYLDRAKELLGDPGLTTVWANGMYDLFVLRHREGVDFRARVDDVQIAWHAAYPELAGAKEDKRKHRFTRKSLSFLASLSVYDAWWKGDYETTEEFYIYNGKDCCITLDVWNWVQGEMANVGAFDTYEHERGLIWPCVDMLARGLRVDEDLRRARVEALTADVDRVAAEAINAALPLLEREEETLRSLGRLDLFQETDATCPCCRSASKKQAACWACAGFEKAPTKAEMLASLNGEGEEMKKLTKAELEERLLPTCRVCEGAPRETRWAFNANSSAQMITLLYDVLKLPKKFNRGANGKSTLTVNEQALKTILGGIPS